MSYAEVAMLRDVAPEQDMVSEGGVTEDKICVRVLHSTQFYNPAATLYDHTAFQPVS